jgi:hypothetical protein
MNVKGVEASTFRAVFTEYIQKSKKLDTVIARQRSARVDQPLEPILRSGCIVAV